MNSEDDDFDDYEEEIEHLRLVAAIRGDTIEALKREVSHQKTLLHSLCNCIEHPEHAGIWNDQTMKAMKIVSDLRWEVIQLKAETRELKANK